jgi:hypothetical protein
MLQNILYQMQLKNIYKKIKLRYKSKVNNK